MEENVATPAINEAETAETVQLDTAQVDEVSAFDLMSDEPEPTVAEPPAQDDAAVQTEQTITQADFDRIMGQRLGDERRRLQNDPFYRMGQMLAQREAEARGISAQEAAAFVLQDAVERRAKTLQEDPAAMARAMAEREFGVLQAPNKTEQTAEHVANELVKANKSGMLPANFDLQATMREYPHFVSDVQALGVSRALENATNAMELKAARQKLAQTQKTLPQSTRPGANTPNGEIDYLSLSSADFEKAAERIRRAAAEGKRVKF